MTPVAQVSKVPAGGWSARVADVFSLTKPRLSSLVMFTAAGGLWLSGAPLSPWRWLLVLFGTWGTVGSANALNCYLERETDKHMARTAKRPLPAGRLEPGHVLWGAIALGLVSLPLLALGGNLLSAGLGALALLSYVLVYTPLKPRSGWAMLAGALPGALPPLMGWAAGTGEVGPGGLSLFCILFVWQLPHTLAIALYRREDYLAAGLKSVAIERGEDVARAWAVSFCGLLLPISVAPYFTGVVGRGYLGAAVLLSGLFLAYAVYGAVRRLGATWARRFFLSSLLYLVLLFAALGAAGRLRG